MNSNILPKEGSSVGLQLFASVRIFGSNLDFEKISRTLEVDPIHTHRAGELSLLKKPYPSDLWLLESPLPHTEPMDAHLLWLREKLLPHYGFLQQLAPTSDVSSYCGITADGGRATFRVSADALRIFVELDICMELSLVLYGAPLERGLPETDRAADPEGRKYRTESEAAFRIEGDGLDFDGISDLLGLTASQMRRGGVSDLSGSARDLWSLSSPLSQREPLDLHLDWLAGTLSPRSDSIRTLADGNDLVIYCRYGTENPAGGVAISPQALGLPLALGIPLELDFQYV